MESLVDFASLCRALSFALTFSVAQAESEANQEQKSLNKQP